MPSEVEDVGGDVPESEAELDGRIMGSRKNSAEIRREMAEDVVGSAIEDEIEGVLKHEGELAINRAGSVEIDEVDEAKEDLAGAEQVPSKQTDELREGEVHRQAAASSSSSASEGENLVAKVDGQAQGSKESAKANSNSKEGSQESAKTEEEESELSTEYDEDGEVLQERRPKPKKDPNDPRYAPPGTSTEKRHSVRELLTYQAEHPAAGKGEGAFADQTEAQRIIAQRK